MTQGEQISRSISGLQTDREVEIRLRHMFFTDSNAAIRGIPESLNIPSDGVERYLESSAGQLSNYTDFQVLPALPPWAEALGLPQDSDQSRGG